ncbi:uncharacterized protein LOC126380845 [Pectinophora gossypiella]|uniref:uncharacterized protein LOC126370916 n=1 Tax=Pectinophora gossypiella TaxID=13191 RepID=UPI00214E9EBB|nr:uncharacterized protein LOC126370916 [Pectinophora gossypiella]XP_049886392.1 uncharacterized protein LOC126380845 [Pectinophora gossypiella]
MVRGSGSKGAPGRSPRSEKTNNKMEKQIRNSSPPAGTPSERPRPSSEGKPHTYTAGGKDCFVGQQDAGLREHDQGCENGNRLSSDVRELRSRRTTFYPAFAETGLDVSAPAPSPLPEAVVVLERISIPDEEKVDMDVDAEKAAPSDGTDTNLVAVPSRSGSPEIRSRFWAEEGPKRRRLTTTSSTSASPSGSDGEETATKGRARRSNTGKYAGLSKAQAYVTAVRNEFLKTQAAEEIAGYANQVSRTRVARPSESPSTCEAPTKDLNQQVLDALEVVEKVATKSGNLKGTLVKALKDAKASIQAAFEVIVERTSTDVTRQLQADNARIQADNARLQAQMASLQNELINVRVEMELLRKLQGAPAPPPDVTNESSAVKQTSRGQRRPQKATSAPNDEEDLARTIMVQVGTMVNARLEALEGRLLPERRLRPPLSADKKRSQASPAVKPTPAQTEPIAKSGGATTVHPAPAEAKKGKKKKKTKKKKKKKGKAGAVQQAAAPRVPRPLPSAPSTMEEPWNVVAKKGTKKQATTTQKKSGPVKLHPPRTAAVVLTLQPGAEENGASYAGVLAQARARIKLDELGIGAVRFRRAVTGARILEVTGSTSNEKADSLAQKLREVLDEDVVRVNRPIRSAEMRISGLDDSVTAEDLVAAVARAGQCAADQVKPGEIRRDKTGLGSVWLRCPVAAAKKVSEGGRLLVGWVAAQVKLLETRPMRCYRCLETGHVRATCDVEVDRSNLCYRCGQAGHIGQKCTAAPHCAICEAAGKPAHHRMGSCVAPSKRRNRGRKAGVGSRASSLPVRPSANAEARAEVEPTMAVD